MINVYSIESRFNKLIEDIEDLTFNYVYCLDEVEDENTILLYNPQGQVYQKLSEI